MTIPKVGNVAGAGPSQAVDTAKEKFGKVLESTGKASKPGGVQGPSEVAPRQVMDGAQRAEQAQRAQPGCTTSAKGVSQAHGVQNVQQPATARSVQAAQVLDQVSAAQKRLDHILEMAQAGKNFTPAELIAMQAHVYRASQELDLAGKVVEKATGGVKQVLQTQV